MFALQLLRTDEHNNTRHYSDRYKVYLPYLAKEYAAQLLVALQTSNHERDLDTGQQNLRTKILRLLVETGYSEDSRILFDQALLFSNHSDFNRIHKKIKKLLKAPNSKDINQLLDLCKHAIIDIDQTKPMILPKTCEGILYYGN